MTNVPSSPPLEPKMPFASKLLPLEDPPPKKVAFNPRLHIPPMNGVFKRQSHPSLRYSNFVIPLNLSVDQIPNFTNESLESQAQPMDESNRMEKLSPLLKIHEPAFKDAIPALKKYQFRYKAQN